MPAITYIVGDYVKKSPSNACENAHRLAPNTLAIGVGVYVPPHKNKASGPQDNHALDGQKPGATGPTFPKLSKLMEEQRIVADKLVSLNNSNLMVSSPHNTPTKEKASGPQSQALPGQIEGAAGNPDSSSNNSMLMVVRFAIPSLCFVQGVDLGMYGRDVVYEWNFWVNWFILVCLLFIYRVEKNSSSLCSDLERGVA